MEGVITPLIQGWGPLTFVFLTWHWYHRVGSRLLRYLSPLSPQVCLKKRRKWSHIYCMLEYKTGWGEKWSNLYACCFFYNQELKIHLDYFTFGTVMLKRKASKLHLLGQIPSPTPENHQPKCHLSVLVLTEGKPYVTFPVSVHFCSF